MLHAGCNYYCIQQCHEQNQGQIQSDGSVQWTDKLLKVDINSHMGLDVFDIMFFSIYFCDDLWGVSAQLLCCLFRDAKNILAFGK